MRHSHDEGEGEGKPCPRTFAVHQPGIPQPGVVHNFRWTGSVPLTGRLRCTLCGLDATPSTITQDHNADALLNPRS